MYTFKRKTHITYFEDYIFYNGYCYYMHIYVSADSYVYFT